MPRAGQEKRTTYRDYRRALIAARAAPDYPHHGRMLVLAVGLSVLGLGLFLWSVATIERSETEFWRSAALCPAEVVDVWENVEDNLGSDTHHWTYYLDIPCVERPDEWPISSPETLHSDESPLSVGDRVTAASYGGDWYVVQLLEHGLQVAPSDPSENHAEPEVPSPTSGPDPDLVFTGIDTDQPCTASVSGAQPAGLGVGLEDVPAMVSEDDLREAVAPVKLGEGQEWVISSGFQDNVSLSDSRNSFTWPEACYPFIQFGRVTGFTAEAAPSCTTDECWEDEGDSDNMPRLVLASVHLLQSGAGAQAFLEWLSPQLWNALLGQCPWCDWNDELQARGTPKVSQVHRDGVTVTRVTGSANIGDAQLVLARQGRVVAEVLMAGPPDGLPDVDAQALALKMAARIAATPARPDPYDITQVMSAPLRAESIPATSNVDDCAPEPACPPPEFTGGGGYDNAAFIHEMGGREEQAARHITKYGRTVTYFAAYSLPSDRSVQTSFTQYASGAAARSALADLASQAMTGGFPYELGSDNVPILHGRFDVPGIDGAVGVAIALNHQGIATSPHWIIYFPHGHGLATVRVGGPLLGGENANPPTPDPFSSDTLQQGTFDGEALAIQLARTMDDRLDRILG